jgi:serine O-acetyltransferase
LYDRVKKSGVGALFIPVNANWHAVLLYRLSHLLFKLRVPLIPHFIYWLNYLLFSVEIHYKAQIGKKFTIGHTVGVVIGNQVVIGDNCTIYSGAVLGARGGRNAMPMVGDNVLIGTGAKLLGCLTVGNNAKIGANSVVIKDVEAGAVIMVKQ